MTNISKGASIAITNVTAVLPYSLVENATVVVEDGIITSIVSGGHAPIGAIDGNGALCIPGIVDSHSDGLEKEIMPRPNAPLPIDFALRSYEGRVRAAGVTTIFHGIGFENDSKYGRTIKLANGLCDAIQLHMTGKNSLVDHRILYRLDARDADGFDAFLEAGDIFAKEPAQKLYEHIYSAGNRQDPMQAYVAFRGREPTVVPLLTKRRLN